MNPLSRLIVDSAYGLLASEGYQRRKAFFRNLLDNNEYSLKRYFDYMMITLIFLSVVILIREVKHPVNDLWLFFNNFVISFVFLTEYLLRFWIASESSKIVVAQYEKDTMLQRKFRLSHALKKIVRAKWEYVRSVTAIIDLLAIVPFFHQMRLLRIFILFRVFKLFRYARSLQTFGSVLATKKFEFLTLLMFASIVIFISAVLIYVMEANNPDSPIDTLYEAFYWAIVTISTVGFGDITPVTDAGRFVAMVIIIAGVAVLSFTTSIVVSAFTEKLDEIKDVKTIDDVTKLKRFYLICGYEDVAHQVAAKLRRSGRRVIVMDRDPEHIKRAKAHGLIALPYDPGALESYGHLKIDFKKQVISVLCLREDDVQNIYTALTIRSMDTKVKILAILMNRQNHKKLQLAGVDDILYTQELIGMIAKEFSGKPVAFEAIHALRSEQTSVKIEEISVDERMCNNFTFIREFDFDAYHLLLMGVYKQGKKEFLFNPMDDTILEEGDILLLIGEKSFISEFNLSIHTKRQP
ncbi:MAG: ion transporter [Campylobacterota bacterium]|nr:ion transporter [Campylobacterota bacterium]